MIRAIPYLFLSVSTLGALVAQAAIKVPDYRAQVYHGDAAHPNLWAIELTPPAGHHFNLEAPRMAQQEKFNLELAQESQDKIIFQTEKTSVHSGSVIETSAFLCDEKKTYCIKKKVFVPFDQEKAKVITEKFAAKKEARTAAVPVEKTSDKTKQESELFIDNDVARALKEAKSSQKPILIDFYGIWCPPCNLYNETIFNTKEFAEQAKRFVLLKLDADSEKSFALKSQFKVGGYPTLVMAKLNAADKLEEIERVVGYFPPKEFYARLDAAYTHRNDTMEQRWKGRFEEWIASLLEQKNYDQIIKATSSSKEAKIQLYRFIAETKKNAEFLKEPKNLAAVKETLAAIAKNIQQQSSDTLVHAVDLLSDEFWVKQKEYYQMANEFLDQLAKRIDPNTLFVSGTELTAPDLDAIRMDLAETLEDNATVAKIRKSAIANYEKLINFFANKGSRDLRSMNLEYAYLLWKDGKVAEAKKLYSDFIKKFPAEFTFYYAASKMYLTLNELPMARDMAEKAFKYSYGDNRIRAMDRLVTVMGEQGDRDNAILKGNEFLATVKVPTGLDVRTGKYVETLKKTISKIEKQKEEKK